MFGRKEIEKRLKEVENKLNIKEGELYNIKYALYSLLITHSKYKLGDQVEFNNYEPENRFGVISKILISASSQIDYRITDSHGNDFSVYENNIKKVIKNVCKK